MGKGCHCACFGISSNVLGIFQGPKNTQPRSQAMSLSGVHTVPQTIGLWAKPGAKREIGKHVPYWSTQIWSPQGTSGHPSKAESQSRMTPSRGLSPSPWRSCRHRTPVCTGAHFMNMIIFSEWWRLRSVFLRVSTDLRGNMVSCIFQTHFPTLSL